MKIVVNKYFWFYLPYLLIVLITFGVNYPIIFFYKSMYLDDMGRYSLGLEGKLHPLIMLESPLGAYLFDVAHKLMVESLVYARVYITTFFLLSNIILFFILNRLLKIPVLISFIATIFPAILPGQTMIPGFIAGSYSLPGSFFLFLSMVCSYEYLHSKSRGWLNIFLFLAMYISSLLIMPNGLFYFMPMILLFFVFNNFKLNNKIVILIFSVIAVDVVKVLRHIYINPATSQVATDLDFSRSISRIQQSLFYLFPISFSSVFEWIMTGVFFVFFVMGFVRWVRSLNIKSEQGLDEKIKENFPIILGLAWIVSGSIVFWLISPYFADRYFHLVSYGSGLVVAFIILKNKKFGAAVLLALIFFMCVNKLVWQYSYVHKNNAAYFLLKTELSKINYPLDSQIIVVGNSLIQTGGYWQYSSSYLRYLVNRSDLMGSFSYPELQFYNPFNPSERGFDTHMTGLDLSKPIFLYRQLSGKFIPMKYALQWDSASWAKGIPGSVSLDKTVTEKLIHSSWKIYRFDTATGKHDLIKNGNGLEDYKAAIVVLSQNGVAESDILWAGPMRDDAKVRFGLVDSN